MAQWCRVLQVSSLPKFFFFFLLVQYHLASPVFPERSGDGEAEHRAENNPDRRGGGSLDIRIGAAAQPPRSLDPGENIFIAGGDRLWLLLPEAAIVLLVLSSALFLVSPRHSPQWLGRPGPPSDR